MDTRPQDRSWAARKRESTRKPAGHYFSDRHNYSSCFDIRTMKLSDNYDSNQRPGDSEPTHNRREERQTRLALALAWP